MTRKFATPEERDLRTVQAPEPKWQIATLVVGLLIGACLGPGVFIFIAHFEPKGDVLVPAAIGLLVAFGISLVLATIASLVLLPRILSNARGTLTAVVEDLTQASQAQAQGHSDAALAHFGRALQEGAAWYSVVATRRFVMHAALGLLISFGGIVGAVLLLRQNALLAEQNNKIEQQTSIADAQKRSAFVSEMFSILQEVAKEVSKEGRTNRDLSKELVARIVVLTSSAVPYFYLNHWDEAKRPIPIALSPERGQLALALARMNVDLAPLIKAGAIFEYSDLRGFDLSGANFSSARLSGSFSGADIASAKFKATQLDNATFLRVRGAKADFSDADLAWVSIKESFFALANFTGAKLSHVSIVGGDFTGSLFDQAEYDKLSFVDVACLELPSGLPWPESIQSSAPVPPVGSKKVRHTFEGTLSLESVLLRQGPMVRPNFRPLLP